MADLVNGRMVGKAGRPNGALEKSNADIRRMVLTALNNAGGAKYLERQAHANPVAFMGLLGKILPTQMKLEAETRGDAPVAITLSWLEPGKRFSGGWRDDPAPLVQDLAPKALQEASAPLAAPSKEANDALW